MEKQITFENLRSYAYLNDRILSGSIRGIVLRFTGLGGMNMYEDETDEGKYFAERGILFLFPYVDPWGWMNPQQIEFTDEILDTVISHFGLSENIPIVSTGMSMGGQSALVYMVYAKRTPVSCVVNCPVCDLPYHFTERPDLPRTLVSAFWNVPGSREEVLSQFSPLHLADKLPDRPYTVYHCEKDTLVDLNLHSKTFVKKMQAAGKNITLISVPDRDHCDLPAETLLDYYAKAAQAILAE